MRLYLVKDSLTTDRQDDITPIVNLCDECAEELRTPLLRGLSIVREVGEYDPAHGVGCYRCGADPEDDD